MPKLHQRRLQYRRFEGYMINKCAILSIGFGVAGEFSMVLCSLLEADALKAGDGR
jgi:hypothetical protein